MNGKLLLRLIESGIRGNVEQVRVMANMLSADLKQTEPELSSKIHSLSAETALRGTSKSNPHIKPLEFKKQNEFIKEYDGKRLVLRPILSDKIELSIQQILNEHLNRDKLHKHQLEPIKSIIFTGPPGVGKTLTAEWMAESLNIPLVVLDLASVMSSFLGKTGNNLKSVIDFASKKPCVLLLDEFDAIAKKRDDESDIGELKRLVTVLLQMLDDWPSTSLLIAATNHPELLDPAVWRRFEDNIKFENPHDFQIQKLLDNLTGDSNISQLFSLFRGYSYSDIKTLVNKGKKYCIINDIGLLEHLTDLYISDNVLENMSSHDKKSLIKVLVSNLKMSQRDVSKKLKISRQTVSKVLSID